MTPLKRNQFRNYLHKIGRRNLFLASPNSSLYCPTTPYKFTITMALLAGRYRLLMKKFSWSHSSKCQLKDLSAELSLDILKSCPFLAAWRAKKNCRTGTGF